MSDTVPMTLSEFLLARYAERERHARECAEVYPSPWEVSDRGHTATVRADEPTWLVVTQLEQWSDSSGWLSDYLQHIANHDPVHVLADIEAKRRIVEEHRLRDAEVARPICDTCWNDRYMGHEDYPCPTIRYLAVPFADHPDYRAEWRP